MNYFIKNIHVNKLLHLENFDIPIDNKDCQNLIITGKNGSGKTILLNAIANYLNMIKSDTNSHYSTLEKNLSFWKKQLESTSISAQEKLKTKSQIENITKQLDAFKGKVNLSFMAVEDIIDKYSHNRFVIAFYQAARKPEMSEPKNPTKPTFNRKGDVKETATSQFLNFLSDLKIQEALARNERQTKDADQISAWFNEFEQMLKLIFEDDQLKLEFNYRDYSFKICSEDKKFKFTQVSDGFAAIIDIVADLILKMQDDNSLTRTYLKEGIVLIDEIETHLHLGLQKVIMPILTKVFPNIQFIITTHSPFVLSSLSNAVAYDLEHKKPIENLTNYSYESLAEGYFGVRAESSDVRHRLNKMKELLEKEELTASEKESIKYYIKDFDSIPEAVSPSLIGEYLQLKLKYIDKIKELMQ